MNLKQIIKLIIALCIIDDEEFEELKRQTAQKKKKEGKRALYEIIKRKIKRKNY